MRGFILPLQKATLPQATMGENNDFNGSVLFDNGLQKHTNPARFERFLSDEGRRGGGLVLPHRRQLTAGLVVTREAVDTRLWRYHVKQMQNRHKMRRK